MNIEPLRGEIWLANLSPTIGNEQKGLRPVLVISENQFNSSKLNLCVIIPLTTKGKNYPSHIKIEPVISNLKQTSYIMCEAIRSVSKTRLIKKMGIISEDTLNNVREILNFILDF